MKDMFTLSIVSLVIPACTLTSGFIRVLSLYGTNDLCIQMRSTFIGEVSGLSILCAKFETIDKTQQETLGLMNQILGIGTCCKGEQQINLLHCRTPLFSFENEKPRRAASVLLQLLKSRLEKGNRIHRASLRIPYATRCRLPNTEVKPCKK